MLTVRLETVKNLVNNADCVLSQELIEDELSLTHCIVFSVYLHLPHNNRPRSGILIIITRKIEPFNPAQSSKNDLRDNNILL